ncbi:MAG: HD domain-containing phosphohydrolase [bacterium]
MSEKPRVLCVDDEINILKAIQRSLRKDFEVHLADGGKEGLRLLQEDGPFQVVVSDMKMPEMNGATFLRHARRISPQTARILLTGFAELDNVVSAVNEGFIFRFLAKPCSSSALKAAIDDGVRQNELLMSERVLLEQTLMGSIQALSDVLAMASPAAFGRATRIRKLAVALGERAELEEPWRLEVAATFSQVGSITLPEDTALKMYLGQPLSLQEQAMAARMPEMSRSVLSNIPRLEPVLEILLYSGKNWDGSGEPQVRMAGEDIPLGSRILKLAEAAEKQQSLGLSPGRTIDFLKAQAGAFDPHLLGLLETIIADGDVIEEVRGVTMYELRTGMVLTEEVRSNTGVLLVAAGQEVTVSLLERIQNYHDTTGLKLPLWVRNPDLDEDPAATAEEQTTFSLVD